MAASEGEAIMRGSDSRTTCRQDAAIEAFPAAGEAMARWAAIWAVPGLPQRVSISFSRRMTRALGRYSPSRASIRLHPGLRQAPVALLLEVLCHELAHAAAAELHGPRRRPHGPEWSRLMRQAGYLARARLPHELVPADLIAAPRRARLVYEHRCPTCEVARMARRPVRAWRCARCIAQGRHGRLSIHKHERGPG